MTIEEEAYIQGIAVLVLPTIRDVKQNRRGVIIVPHITTLTPVRNQPDSMPNLTLKRVPEELHERLKERAERHRRSMNNEAITILERALMPSRPTAEEAIAEAEALNDRLGTIFDAALIEEKKREGLS